MKKTIMYCLMLGAIPAMMMMSCKKDSTTTTPTATAAKPSLYDTLGVFLKNNGPSTGALGGDVKAGDGSTTNSASGNAYGTDAITATIDGFLTNVLADTVINKRFTAAGKTSLRTMLIDQICSATGGPCKYTGFDMKTAHTTALNTRAAASKANVSMITATEFNALVNDLVKQMTALKIPSAVQGSIAKLLLPMQSDIVGNK